MRSQNLLIQRKDPSRHSDRIRQGKYGGRMPLQRTAYAANLLAGGGRKITFFNEIAKNKKPPRSGEASVLYS